MHVRHDVQGLDGRLQKATKLKGIKNFKASEMGLLPVAVEKWQGFTFMHPGASRQADSLSLCVPTHNVQQQCCRSLAVANNV